MLKILVPCFLIFAFAAQAETAFKIATVDMQKAIQTTTAGKKAKTELEGEFNKRKKELEKKEGDLKKMKEDIEKKQAVLSEEVLGKKQAEFRDEMMKYQETVQKNQMEIQKKERDLTQPILEKMRKIIANVAKEKNFSMVIENSAMVLYADQGLDITDDVIKSFEKEK